MTIYRYGIPNKLYLDNVSPYKNEQLSLICGSLGIVELHTLIKDGASKDKVERNFRTLKSRWLNTLDIKSISSLVELNDELFSYINKHNITIHSSTNEKPIDRYNRDLAHIKIANDSEWLDNCFMNRINRRVNNDATISIVRISYDVPMQFIGQKIEVRYLPCWTENGFKKDGALHAFLCTDTELSTQTILKYYSKRYPIEVFFKQPKITLD